MAGFEAQIGDLPVRARAGAVAFDRAKGLGQAALQAWTLRRVAERAIPGDDAAAARDQIHQALECGFYRVEIFVDVGVIELDGGEDDGVGKVVEEFWSLVEEGSVIFVAFEDEVLPRPEMEAGAEVFGDAADQERRIG